MSVVLMVSPAESVVVEIPVLKVTVVLPSSKVVVSVPKLSVVVVPSSTTASSPFVVVVSPAIPSYNLREPIVHFLSFFTAIFSCFHSF